MSDISWRTDDGKEKARTEVKARPVDTIDGWKIEIASSYSTMQDFTTMDPMEVFQSLSQFSARASEMRSRIGTTASKEWQNFRIRVIDPFIEECDRQFKIHSRLMAIQEMDARLAGGRFT